MTRRRILTPAQVSIIDAWYSIKGRNKQPPAKCMAHKMGCSLRTLWNAIHRRDGYAKEPTNIESKERVRRPSLLSEAAEQQSLTVVARGEN
jgi:hypothetical protein